MVSGIMASQRQLELDDVLEVFTFNNPYGAEHYSAVCELLQLSPDKVNPDELWHDWENHMSLLSAMEQLDPPRQGGDVGTRLIELLNKNDFWPTFHAWIRSHKMVPEGDGTSRAEDFNALLGSRSAMNGDVPPLSVRKDLLRAARKGISAVEEAESDEDASEEVDEGPLLERPVNGEAKLNMDVGKALARLDGNRMVFPKWQRNSDAWNISKKRNLIRSILLGIPLPALIIHEPANGPAEVVDGRQRLSALQQFRNDEFTTANFSRASGGVAAPTQVIEGGNLDALSGKKYSEIKGTKVKNSSGQVRSFEEIFNDTLLPVLEFKNLTSSQLYFIFTVYNTNSTSLNAAEIRNAVYHEHPLHKALIFLAGDDSERREGKEGLTRPIRTLLSPKDGDPKRFKATDFLAKYLVYTLPVSAAVERQDERLVKASNKKHIEALMELDKTQWTAAYLTTLGEEMAEAMEACELIAQRYSSFDPHHGRTGGGKRSFNAVKSIASLTASSMLNHAFKSGTSKDGIESLVTTLAGLELPANHYAGLVWKYQFESVLAVRDWLGGKGTDLAALENGRWKRLVEEAVKNGDA